jgi:hypothetical protein
MTASSSFAVLWAILVRMIIAHYVQFFWFGWVLKVAEAVQHLLVPLRSSRHSFWTWCTDTTCTPPTTASSAVEFVKFEVSCFGFRVFVVGLGS